MDKWQSLLEMFGAVVLFFAHRFRRKKIALLCVDDNAEDIEILVHYIHRCGYATETCDTAEAAIALLQIKSYPIVFVDGRLPMMSGYDFVKRVQKSGGASHVVVVSGQWSDLEELPRGFYVGLVLKPISQEAVEDVLKKTRL